MKPDTPTGTTFQLPLLPQPHRNQQLFSDHYLNSILPERDEWRMLAIEAGPVMQQLQAILAAYVPSENEAQTEENFVKPVLKTLEHVFEVQATLETPDGTKRPDYFFYRDSSTMYANRGRKLNETLLQGLALAVGDAKYWDRPLDVSLKRAGGDLFDNKNPSYQIFFYMQHSGLDWGVLTNGRLWRLYHKDTAHKLDRFYEVDLPALLQAGDVNHFLYFYAFFRRQAFEPGALNLTDILHASAEYARGVGDSLKKQVYDALLLLAQGFLDYTPNQLQPDASTLKVIYDNALIVLYRLLFILYAEARDLLPVIESEPYRRNYSLKAVKEAIKRDLDTHNVLLSTSVTIWPKLKALFSIINEGSPPLHVATFNGGLFDPARHPFLEQYSVGDARLQQAIDMLARVDGQFVDYRDLAERHLGTIYEGLLEFHLEPLELPEENRTIRLVNAKGERKATGSYYTPDYIVKYMVEETVGPVLQTTVAQASSDEERIAAILNVKVLDPAMGSGHFPVEATEYIARFLVEHVEQAPADTSGEADLAYWKRRVAQSCIYGVDLNPLAVDLAKLSLWLTTVAKNRPLSFLDHHLRCGNSLIGARIADLRAGLGNEKRKTGKKAQVTVVEGTAMAQGELFDEESLRQTMTTAVNSMSLIESSPAQTLAEVKAQEQTYQQLHQMLSERYSTLANVVTATRFGLEISPAYTKFLVDFVLGRALIPLPQVADWVREATEHAKRLSFFHWELEFPEVFFDRFGQYKGAVAGFDVVIGNPPYVRQEGLGELKTYFETAYPDTYDSVADLYVYFYEQAVRLARADGRMAYIVTNKWMRVGYGGALRAYFAEQAALERIIDFGHAPIFEDADVFPCILVLRKPKPEEQAALSMLTVQALTFPREELGKVNLARYIREQSQSLSQSRFGHTAWNLESSAVDDLLAKIRQRGIPLAQFASMKPFYGIKTGRNEAFLIDTPTKDALVRADPHSAKIIKPYLRGQDIKRWSPEWAGLWIITLKSSGDHIWPWSNAPDEATAETIFQQTFPSLHNHLKPLEVVLRNRQDQGRYWWELRACAYYNLFDQPKIIHTDITWRPQFAFSNAPIYLLNTAYMWPMADLYVLAVVNSPLLWSYMWRNAIHGKDEALRLIYTFVETLPIAPPSERTRAEAEPAVARLIALAKQQDEARQILFDWLRTEFGVETPGAHLEDVGKLDKQVFVDEVRKRLPKSAKHPTPAVLKRLYDGYTEQAIPARQRLGEAQALEHRLSDLVNASYGLTSEEIALLWETAPPRMPQL